MGLLETVIEIDMSISRRIHRMQVGPLEYFCLFFGFIFNQYFILLVPLVTYYKVVGDDILMHKFYGHSFSVSGKQKMALGYVMMYLLTVVVTLLVTLVTKKFFGRIRPSIINKTRRFNLRKYEENCSMPSGDSAQSANWGMMMALYLNNPLYLLV